MAKRQLPLRANRGKNSFYKMETDEKLVEKIRIIPKKNKKLSETSCSEELEKKLKIATQTRRQIYNENKRNFRFTRGIHYFYDLTQLQRIPQSVSYAIFPSKKQKKITKANNYTVNYSKDDQLIGNLPISSLINRNYIGLPQFKQTESEFPPTFMYNEKTVNEVIEMKRNDKNQCHHYLFEAEDKKHNLDRIITQLQFINKKINYFLLPQNFNKLKKFSIIEKDNDLSDILFESPQVTNEQKKEALLQKIEGLKEKRYKLDAVYENVADTYFHNSLDQKLFNEIKKQKQKLNRFSIYQEMQKSMKQHQKQNIIIENSDILENFQHFHQQSSYSRHSQIDDYFCIDEKMLDPFIMEKTLKLISIRLFNEGENCFYFAKKTFMKLFKRQLTLQKQIRPITVEQYKSKLKQIEESLQKYWKKRSLSECQSNNQNNLNLNSQRRERSKGIMAKSKVQKSEMKLKINERVVPIGFYEYYCLKIFIAIYDALTMIGQFMHKSQSKRLNLIQHLASLNYPKFQNRIVSIIQIPKFGLLSEALDKLVDVITHKNKQFESMNYELFIQFDQKEKQILTFVKQIQSSSVSDQSSMYKRQLSTSQIMNGNQQSQMEEEDIFDQGRKMIK